MEKPAGWWQRLPTAVRIMLTVIIFIPLWFVLFSSLLALADAIAPRGKAGSGLNSVVLGGFLVLIFLLLRWWTDREHGGPDQRRAFQSAIRTGVISPQADRERLREAVRLHTNGRRRIPIVILIACAAVILANLPLLASAPERGWLEVLRFAVFSTGPMLILIALMVIILKRRDRQMARLERSLESGDQPS